jgi:hypothetical protein
MNPNIENNTIITVITIPAPIAEQQIMISVLLRELAENEHRKKVYIYRKTTRGMHNHGKVC